jgi:hypothetical protein
MSITEVTSEPAYSGHYRQVVLIQRCIGITEVASEPAYSGLYRQVVLLLQVVFTVLLYVLAITS